jgi:hypothetical protein
MEPEGPSGYETSFRVEQLDERVGETVLDGGDARGSVFTFSSRQTDEMGNPTTLRPSDLTVRCGDGTGSCSGHRDAQSFCEGPGAVESRIRGGDVVARLARRPRAPSRPQGSSRACARVHAQK